MRVLGFRASNLELGFFFRVLWGMTRLMLPRASRFLLRTLASGVRV